MTRKNKLMLAAAIVAAVLLVGSGVARCTLAQNGSTEGRAAVESAEEAAVENPQSETDAADGEASSGIESSRPRTAARRGPTGRLTARSCFPPA